jgi:hypothetical protein
MPDLPEAPAPPSQLPQPSLLGGFAAQPAAPAAAPDGGAGRSLLAALQPPPQAPAAAPAMTLEELEAQMLAGAAAGPPPPRAAQPPYGPPLGGFPPSPMGPPGVPLPPHPGAPYGMPPGHHPGFMGPPPPHMIGHGPMPPHMAMAMGPRGPMVFPTGERPASPTRGTRVPETHPHAHPPTYTRAGVGGGRRVRNADAQVTQPLAAGQAAPLARHRSSSHGLPHASLLTLQAAPMPAPVPPNQARPTAPVAP